LVISIRFVLWCTDPWTSVKTLKLATAASLPFVLNPTSSNWTHSDQIFYAQTHKTHCWLGGVVGQNVAVCSTLWLCCVVTYTARMQGKHYAFQTYFPVYPQADWNYEHLLHSSTIINNAWTATEDHSIFMTRAVYILVNDLKKIRAIRQKPRVLLVLLLWQNKTRVPTIALLWHNKKCVPCSHLKKLLYFLTILQFWCGKIFKIPPVILQFRSKETCSFRERMMKYVALHLCILVPSHCLYSLRRKVVTIKNRSHRDAQFLWHNLSDIRSATERVVRMATSLKHYV
jgi:hypothetical protein